MEVIERGCRRQSPGAGKENNILKAKGSTSGLFIGKSVFTRTVEVIESNCSHVGDGKCKGSILQPG